MITVELLKDMTKEVKSGRMDSVIFIEGNSKIGFDRGTIQAVEITVVNSGRKATHLINGKITPHQKELISLKNAVWKRLIKTGKIWKKD